MLALILLGAVNLAELRRLRVSVGVVVVGRVRKVKAFDAESQRHAFADPELAVERRINVDDAGALDDVAAGVAKGVLRGYGEGAYIKVLLARAGVAEIADRGDPVGPIRVAGGVDDAGDARREPSAGHDAS